MNRKTLWCYALICQLERSSFAFPLAPSSSQLTMVSSSSSSSRLSAAFVEDLSGIVHEDTEDEVPVEKEKVPLIDPDLMGPTPGEQLIVFNDTKPSPQDFDSDHAFLESVILSSTLGSGFQAEDIQDIIKSFTKVQFPKNSLLLSEKDEKASDFLFVVESGQCTVSVEGQQLPAPYGIASPGSIVGELSLVYNTRPVTTVLAKTDVTGFRLDRSALSQWLEKWPQRRDSLKRDLKDIDAIIAKLSGVQTRYGGSVIRRFKPSRTWLWGQWKGTILQHAWKVSAVNLLLATVLVVASHFVAAPTWRFGTMPDERHVLISRMLGLFKVWEYTMSVTTFVLTFFLGQAYTLWRDIYLTARVVQGRLSDINLMLAVSAERDRNGSYTKRARELMEDVASYTRLYHVFMWASLSSKLSLLLSDLGLRRMVSRGVLSRKQLNTIQKLDVSVSPQHACLMWIMTRFLKGMEDNVVPNDMVMKQSLFNKCMELQGTFAGVGGKLAGRAPLAYVHLVQVLVDTFLLLAPFALTCRLGVWGIPAVGILTLFYSGLLDLAKILLHPLGNYDDTYDEAVNMDLAVIIRESNGGSTRWMDGGEVLPF